MLTTQTVQLTLAFGLPGHMEWVLLVGLGLLIFGRRLPEVGRNIGRSIVEFKRGIKGIGDEIEEESSTSGNQHIADHSSKEGLPDGGSAVDTSVTADSSSTAKTT